MNHLKHLLISLILAAPATAAIAETITIDNIEYTYDTSTREATVTDGKKYKGDLVIPETITAEGNVYTVTSIGKYAFHENRLLHTVVTPDNLTTIGEYAFDDCRNITSVTIGNGITEIREFAFLNCFELKTVHISDLKAWCNIDFKEEWSNPLLLESNLYLGDELITDLVIPEGIKEIKQHAFKGCVSITSVTIPNTVTAIRKEAFYDCINIASVKIPDSVTYIGQGVFYNCKNLISVTIPDSVTFINESIFRQCDKLASVTISNTATAILESAFTLCQSLTSVKIPDSVKTIGYAAFMNCSSLSSVTIGNGVTKIASTVFYDCNSLSEINSKNPTPPTIENNTFTSYDATLYVPVGSKAEYQAHPVWKNFYKIEEKEFAGVDEAEEDGGAMLPAEYYDLNGVRVAVCAPGEQPSGLTPGVYISRRGSKTEKVIIP